MSMPIFFLFFTFHFRDYDLSDQTGSLSEFDLRLIADTYLSCQPQEIKCM